MNHQDCRFWGFFSLGERCWWGRRISQIGIRCWVKSIETVKMVGLKHHAEPQGNVDIYLWEAVYFIVDQERPNFFTVQFSYSVMSDSLQPRGLQHARLPCPSLTPGACSNSCPSSWWCHPTISSSVVPCSSCLQSFQASGSFPMSQFFTSGGQNIGVSALASVLPMNIQAWFPLLTSWISLQAKGPSRVFSNITVQKHQFFRAQLFLWSNSHIHMWLLEKP